MSETSATLPAEDNAGLLLLVGDESKGFKHDALVRLLSLEPPELFALLARALRDGENADLRNGAMEVYERLGTRAVPVLIELLADACEEIRNFAAVMLGNIRSRKSVPALIAALRDEDTNVRHAAAEALGKIGDRTALLPLLELLKGDFWVQFPAICALGIMRDHRAVPHLLQLLEDDMLRGYVVDALGSIGDPRALFPLGNILGYTDDHTAGRVAVAMAAIYGGMDDDIRFRNSLFGVGHRFAIKGVVNAKGVQKLRHLLRCAEDADVADACIKLVGWLGDVGALDDLLSIVASGDHVETVEAAILSLGKEAVPGLRGALHDPSDNVKVMALRSLRWVEGLDDPRSLAAYLSVSEMVRLETLEALRGSVDPGLLPLLIPILELGSQEAKHKAVAVLAHFPAPVTTPVAEQMAGAAGAEERTLAATLVGMPESGLPPDLLSRLLTDPSPVVRTEAARAVGTRRFRKKLRDLLALLDDPDEGVREEAIISISQFRDPSTLPQLFRLLGASSGTIDYAVVRAAGRIGSPEAVETLAGYLNAMAPSRRMEFAVIDALGRVGSPSPEIRNIFARYLFHPEPDFRRAAVTGLSTSATELLPEFAEACSDPHWSVRIAALEAVARIAEEEAVPVLVEAFSDPDIMVRKIAVSVVGGRRLLAGIPALIELLLDPDLNGCAFESLLKMGKGALPRIHAAVRTKYVPEVREQLVDILGRIGHARSIQVLIDLLSDTSPMVRLSAIDAMVRCFDTVPLKKMALLMREDPDPDVRSRADLAFKNMTTESFC